MHKQNISPIFQLEWVVLKIDIALTIFQSYCDLEAGDIR